MVSVMYIIGYTKELYRIQMNLNRFVLIGGMFLVEMKHGRSRQLLIHLNDNLNKSLVTPFTVHQTL